MEDSDWTLISEQRLMRHTSGLLLRFTGKPEQDGFGFYPLNIPDGLSALAEGIETVEELTLLSQIQCRHI